MLVRALTRRRVSAGVLTLRCATACAAVTSLSDILSRVTVRQPSLCIDRRYAVACWLALPLVLAVRLAVAVQYPYRVFCIL